MPAAIGLDFGTTNCAIARALSDGSTELARFETRKGPSEIFRSILYIEEAPGGRGLEIQAGPAAVDAYLDSDEKQGRLMQSLKSFLASRLFGASSVFGRNYRLEELIALLLRPLREQAERCFGEKIERALVGRPVHFVHANDAADDEFALARLRAALHNAGFREVAFEYEPVGAAYHYEQSLASDELILIADFGGGTSDFSLLRVGPGFRGSSASAARVLGHDGVGLAGDAFDGQLIEHVVAPRLGKGSHFRSTSGGELPVPGWIYKNLERWHHLSFLRSPKTLRMLYDLRREAEKPERLDALIHVVEHDQGFPLHRATEAAKRALSDSPQAAFHFVDEVLGALEVRAEVTRADFEIWIAEELAAIGDCVERLLARTNTATRDVDRVFLTGGSSLVPAVREIFRARFGEERLRGGAELTSVASGLALCAAQRDA
jgi:hypothetical chaperone protein